jgi:hypothetical protein
MSEFDKLKDDAEHEAQQHPQQVKEGEQYAEKDAEKELGLQQPGQAQQDQAGPGAGNNGEHDQNSGGQGQ